VLDGPTTGTLLPCLLAAKFARPRLEQLRDTGEPSTVWRSCYKVEDFIGSESVMQSATVATKQSQSVKKRPRDEIGHDDEDDNLSSLDSKDTKRRNTSKTPVKSTKSSATNMTATKDVPTSVAKPRAKAAPMAKSRVLDRMPELLIPPAGTHVGSGTKLTSEGSQKAAEKGSEVLESATRVIERESKQNLENQRTAVAAEGYTRSLERWGAGLAVLLVFLTGLLVFIYASSHIVITGLKHELVNCHATKSERAKEDENYLQDLQIQVRTWKQRSNALEAEFEALRTECWVR
jgi:hypothetical protein